MRAFIHLATGLDVVVHPDVTGGFYVTVPILPGCGSQGDSIEETLENVDDAIDGVLEILREDDPELVRQILGTSDCTASSGFIALS